MKNFFSKKIAVCLIISMLTSIFAIPSLAANEVKSSDAITPDTSWFNENAVTHTFYLYDAADLLGFAKLANEGETFEGTTVKVMADIDLNPGWNAITSISNNKATLASTPENEWPEIPVFKGVFDGQGHVIRGIYANRVFEREAVKGGFINKLSGGAVKNVIILNSVTLGSATAIKSYDQRVGGIIGEVAGGKLQTVYAEIDAWWYLGANKQNKFWGSVGAIAAVIGSGYKNNDIDDVVFAGKYGVINSDYGITETVNKNDGGYSALITYDKAGNVSLGDIAVIGKQYKGYKREGNLIWYSGKADFADCYVLSMAAVYVDNDTDCREDDMLNTYCDVIPAGAERWAYSTTETYAARGWKEVSTATTLVPTSAYSSYANKNIQYLPGSVANMVTANTSNLFYQMSNDGDKIRIVGIVSLTEEELEDFSKLGFEVTVYYGDKKYTNTVTTQTVYTSLIADNKPVYASEYGGTYFYAIEITELVSASSDIFLDVDGIIFHKGATQSNVFGSISISEGFDTMLDTLSEFEGATPNRTYTGDDCYMINFGAVERQAFDSYCEGMLGKGFTLYAGENFEGNIYNTYVNAAYVVTAIYTQYNGIGKVLVEPLRATALPVKAEDNKYTPIAGCETTITQLGLYRADDYSETYNGMCYIIRLADGSFIIVDGGVDTTKEKYEDRIYSVLRKQAPDPDNIVIAAWIFTHAHDDHVDIFEFFCESYADKVTVERFIYNFPSDEQAANIWEPVWNRSDNVRACIEEYFSETPVTKAHPGQEFYIRNAKINILFTLDVYEKKLRDFNISSVVFTLEADDKRMIFLGDHDVNHDDGINTLAKLYGSSTLKSDIVQIAHHGLPENNCNAICEIIAPEYAFWPIAAQVIEGTDLFKVSQNKYVVDNCEIFLAEDNVFVFTMKDCSVIRYDTLADYIGK